MAVEPTPRLDFFPAAKSAPANPFSLFPSGNGDAAPFGAVWDRQQAQPTKEDRQPKSVNTPQQTPPPVESQAATPSQKPVTSASPHPVPAEDASTTANVEPVRTEIPAENEDQTASVPEIPGNQPEGADSALPPPEILLDGTTDLVTELVEPPSEEPEPPVSAPQTPPIPASLRAAMQPAPSKGKPTQEQLSARQGSASPTQLTAPPEKLAQAFSQSLPLSSDEPANNADVEKPVSTAEETETEVTSQLLVTVVPQELPVVVQLPANPLPLDPAVPPPTDGAKPDVVEAFPVEATNLAEPAVSPFHTTRFPEPSTSVNADQSAPVTVDPTVPKPDVAAVSREGAEESTENHTPSVERPLSAVPSSPLVSAATVPTIVSPVDGTIPTSPTPNPSDGEKTPSLLAPRMTSSEPTKPPVSAPPKTGAADNQDLIAELLSALTDGAGDSQPEPATLETSQSEDFKADNSAIAQAIPATVRETPPPNSPVIVPAAPVAASERAPVVAQVQAHWPQPALAGQEFAFELTPPELGRLRIELVQSDQGLVARFETETANARQLLHDHLPALRESLALQGTAIDRIEIRYREESANGTGGFGQPAQGDNQPSSDDSSRQRRDARSSRDEEAARTPKSNPQPRSATGRVTQLNIQV